MIQILSNVPGTSCQIRDNFRCQEVAAAALGAFEDQSDPSYEVGPALRVTIPADLLEEILLIGHGKLLSANRAPLPTSVIARCSHKSRYAEECNVTFFCFQLLRSRPAG